MTTYQTKRVRCFNSIGGLLTLLVSALLMFMIPVSIITKMYGLVGIPMALACIVLVPYSLGGFREIASPAIRYLTFLFFSLLGITAATISVALYFVSMQNWFMVIYAIAVVGFVTSVYKKF